MVLRNAFEGLAVESKQETGLATQATLALILAELAQKIEEGGTVALSATDRALLEALETITATVSGTVTANLGTLGAAATEATLLNVRRALTDHESRLDYDVRTDGNPVYVAKNLQGTATSAATWTVQKLTYDSSARLTRAQVLVGTWDGRAALGWT